MSGESNNIQLNRRKVLAAVGAGAGTLAGVGAFSGTAVAWERFDVCFVDCSEAWMVVTEEDIDLGGSNDPPAVAHVIVHNGSRLECRAVEFTAANATTMPAQFGDSPVVKYTVPAGEKILGVLEYNYTDNENERFDDPVWCVNKNTNACATEGDYNLFDAACVPADNKICPPSTVCPDGDNAVSTGWHTAETDTTQTLHDVQDTLTNPFAVGDSGRVLERTGDGVWTTQIEDGPTGDGNNLLAADVTDDGERLWFAGASGALGEYDASTGELIDHSGPNDQTGNFDGLAVTGTADEANVYLTDQSGHVIYSFNNGETWESTTPGSGSAIPAIDFRDDRKGHLSDTNGSVFATEDGETWGKIGIQNAQENYYGIESDGSDDVTVVDGNGTVREYDGSSWSTENLGDARLNGVYTTGTGTGAAVGDGGVVFEDPGAWTQADTPTDENLKNVTYGDVTAAVGASGTTIEK